MKDGQKHDKDKPRFSLLPGGPLLQVVQVLEYGAKKYAPDNWKRVPDPKLRYFDAAMRHLWAWHRGEEVDPESGLSHLAHAACSLLFMLHFEGNPEETEE